MVVLQALIVVSTMGGSSSGEGEEWQKLLIKLISALGSVHINFQMIVIIRI